MKSSWTTCLLLAAVAAVWSIVAWRIFAPPSHGAPDSPPPPAEPAASRSAAETLRVNYPDPFLKGAVRPPAALPQPAVRPLPPAKKAAPKSRQRTPIVHLATMASGGPALHILTIGKEQYELYEGDTADGWRLAAADRDSLYLEREGATCGVKRCE